MSNDKGHFSLLPLLPLHLTAQGPDILFWPVKESNKDNQVLPMDIFLSEGPFKGQTKGNSWIRHFDKVRDLQSFISGGTDFSLMESCRVSAPNY